MKIVIGRIRVESGGFRIGFVEYQTIDGERVVCVIHTLQLIVDNYRLVVGYIKFNVRLAALRCLHLSYGLLNILCKNLLHHALLLDTLLALLHGGYLFLLSGNLDRRNIAGKSVYDVVIGKERVMTWFQTSDGDAELGIIALRRIYYDTIAGESVAQQYALLKPVGFDNLVFYGSIECNLQSTQSKLVCIALLHTNRSEIEGSNFSSLSAGYVEVNLLRLA